MDRNADAQGRAADEIGVNDCLAQLAAGVSGDKLADCFCYSAEFNAIVENLKQ